MLHAFPNSQFDIRNSKFAIRNSQSEIVLRTPTLRATSRFPNSQSEIRNSTFAILYSGPCLLYAD